MTSPDPEERLRRFQDGAAAADVLALFDQLPAVDPAAELGRWRGSELPTGHPFDVHEHHGGWLVVDVGSGPSDR